MQEASEAPSMMLVNHDQPEHTFLRNVARQAFSPNAWIRMWRLGWPKFVTTCWKRKGPAMLIS